MEWVLKPRQPLAEPTWTGPLPPARQPGPRTVPELSLQRETETQHPMRLSEKGQQFGAPSLAGHTQGKTPQQQATTLPTSSPKATLGIWQPRTGAWGERSPTPRRSPHVCLQAGRTPLPRGHIIAPFGASPRGEAATAFLAPS